jgi:hypothetical protein
MFLHSWKNEKASTSRSTGAGSKYASVRNRKTATAGSCQPTLIIQRCILTSPLQAYDDETHIRVFCKSKFFYRSIIFHSLRHMRDGRGKLYWRPAYLSILMVYLWSRDSSVGIAAAYGLDGYVWIPGRGKNFFSSPQLADRLLGPPSLLYNGHRRFSPEG